MTFLRSFPILGVILATVLLTAPLLIAADDAQAQAAHDTSLLTDKEREHYALLLSKAYDSAERAKIKSEMNRLIQTRRLERRTPPPQQ